MSDDAIDIMDKYKDNVSKRAKSKHFLPVITNQKLNYYLKELGRIAEIDTLVEKISYYKGDVVNVMVPKYEILTFHKSRHTFATLSLQRGMPLPVLQKILGHQRIEETMTYDKVVDTFQHDQLLKTWNNEEETKPKEPSENIEDIQKEIHLDELTNEILKADEQGEKELILSYPLLREAITELQQKGFSIENTSPIEKLKGIYHIISW